MSMISGRMGIPAQPGDLPNAFVMCVLICFACALSTGGSAQEAMASDPLSVERSIDLERVLEARPCPRSARSLKDGVLICRCAASPVHSYVYGTDVYTDTSMICGAALHAGAITTAGGMVRVEQSPGLEHYAGTERNGVSSKTWAQRWRASFKVSAVPADVIAAAAARSVEEQSRAPDEQPRAKSEPEAAKGTSESGRDQNDGEKGKVTELSPGERSIAIRHVLEAGPCPRTANSVRGLLICRCAARPRHSYVYGTDVYTDTSMICGAALHAGAINPAGGMIRVEELPGLEHYAGTERNGVSSKTWARRWRASFKVSAVPADVIAATAAQSAEEQSRAPDEQPRAKSQPKAAKATSGSGRDLNDGQPLTVPKESNWAGLWEGGRWSQHGTVPVSLFVGRRSWIRIGRCRGTLEAMQISDTEAEFRFKPEGGPCSDEGSLHAVIRPNARGKVDQETARIVLKSDALDFNAYVAKPIMDATSGYRFSVSDDRFRFLWKGAGKPISEAVRAARSDGFKCLVDHTAYISQGNEEQTFEFESYGNVVGGHLYLVGCAGNCEGSSFTVGSTMNSYVRYSTQYGSPSFYIESRTFFWRKNRVKWRMPVDYETGKVTGEPRQVYIAVLSRDPLDYGRGCTVPF